MSGTLSSVSSGTQADQVVALSKKSRKDIDADSIVTLPCGHKYFKDEFKEKVRFNHFFDNGHVTCPQCKQEVSQSFIKENRLNEQTVDLAHLDDEEKKAELSSEVVGDSDSETEDSDDSETDSSASDASETESEEDDKADYQQHDSETDDSDDDSSDDENVRTEVNDETDESDASDTEDSDVSDSDSDRSDDSDASSAEDGSEQSDSEESESESD